MRLLFCILLALPAFATTVFAPEYPQRDRAIFNARGFTCTFPSGVDYLVDDANTFKSEPSRAPSFTIIIANFSIAEKTALFGIDTIADFQTARVVNLGGAAINFFVDYGRSLTFTTIYTSKSPSTGRFYAAFTEHSLLPLVSGPAVYVATGSCQLR
jgi:hypothetical protein